MDSGHFYQSSSAWRILSCDFNERTACKVRLDRGQWHRAEAEARAKES